MIKKNKYSAPLSEPVSIDTSHPILDGSPWYLQGGKGDFNYEVEEDDTWA